MRGLFDWNSHAYVALPARLYLGFVFISASIHKIALPGQFAMDIATYDILPLALVNLMAICLPWLEIVTGGMLLVGLKVRVAAWCILGMMTMFITALLIALYNEIDMSCGCFASQSMSQTDTISYRTVLRDLAWIGISIYVLLFDRRPIGLERLKLSRR